MKGGDIRAASCPGSLNELAGERKGRLRSVDWACPGRPKGPRFCSQEPDRPRPDSKAARAWNLWLQNPPLPSHHSTPQTCPSWPRPHWEGSWLVEGCGQAHSKASWRQLGSPDPRVTPVLSTWEGVQQARAHWKEEAWGQGRPGEA